MPVMTLVSDWAGTSQIGTARVRSPEGDPCTGLAADSSTMLFHEPQSGHFPSHLGDWLPHFWQAKMVLCFTAAPRRCRLTCLHTPDARWFQLVGNRLMV
jgi:hypothetical protein